jgi:hypothetical protein
MVDVYKDFDEGVSKDVVDNREEADKDRVVTYFKAL